MKRDQEDAGVLGDSQARRSQSSWDFIPLSSLNLRVVWVAQKEVGGWGLSADHHQPIYACISSV